MDVGAYIWPAYTGADNRSRIFWPEGRGEWQSVRSALPKFPGHRLPRVPLLGYQDEADPQVMRQQIDLAADHGVNTFIYDWYWYDGLPYLENCLNDGFLKAENRGRMKFYLMWANHDVNFTWDKRISDQPGAVLWQGRQPRGEFIRITERWMERYFTQPNYYTVDGCPVVMIYDVDNLIKGLGGVRPARMALDDFRRRAVCAGFRGVHIQMVLWSEGVHDLSGVDGSHMNSAELARALGFDSLTNYQYVHFVDIDRDYAKVMRDVERNWASFNKIGIPYWPHVSIGWDNNPRFNSLRKGIMKNNTPEEFGRALEKAKSLAESTGAPMVTINSWNEWTEMSYLLPDDVYGYGYLDEVKRVFGGR